MAQTVANRNQRGGQAALHADQRMRLFCCAHHSTYQSHRSQDTVSFNLVTYNAHLEIFSFTRVLFTFLAAGEIDVQSRIDLICVANYQSTKDFVRAGMELIFITMWVASVQTMAHEGREAWKRGVLVPFLTSASTTIDFLNYALTLVEIIFWLVLVWVYSEPFEIDASLPVYNEVRSRGYEQHVMLAGGPPRVIQASAFSPKRVNIASHAHELRPPLFLQATERMLDYKNGGSTLVYVLNKFDLIRHISNLSVLYSTLHGINLLFILVRDRKQGPTDQHPCVVVWPLESAAAAFALLPRSQ